MKLYVLCKIVNNKIIIANYKIQTYACKFSYIRGYVCFVKLLVSKTALISNKNTDIYMILDTLVINSYMCSINTSANKQCVRVSVNSCVLICCYVLHLSHHLKKTPATLITPPNTSNASKCWLQFKSNIF